MSRLIFAICTALLASGCGSSPAPTNATPPAGPEGDRTAGLTAFETVRGVLQNPRCQNCHPGGDAPLQGDDSHVHLQNVQRGPTGHGMAGAECSTCHGPGNPPAAYGAHIPPGSSREEWHMPGPDMKLVFVGMQPGALCEQMKDPSRNGSKDGKALRAHLDSPLVVWGWSPGFGRAPVPVPREQFLAAWDTWQRAGSPCPN